MNADHMIDWKKTAAEIQDDYAAVCRKRDELLAALEGLHKVCEIALSGKDGKQHAYFETRSGHFVEATKAMQEAEAAIRDELANGAEPVAWMNSRNGFIAKENKNPEYNVGLYTCPPSAAARIAELEEELSAEKESCKLAHDDALRQVEHLGRSEAMISGLESERDALRREVDRLKSTPPEKREDLHCVISDLCAQVRDMEAHYKAALSAEQVRFQQFAASQAREQQLREALLAADAAWGKPQYPQELVTNALAMPKDATALQSAITKAGEVMRERAISAASAINPIYGSGAAIDAIRTVRIVTLDDLKGGAA